MRYSSILSSCCTPTTDSALEINSISNKIFNLMNKMNGLLGSSQASVSRAAATSLESDQPWVKGWTVLGYANKWVPSGPAESRAPGRPSAATPSWGHPEEAGPPGLEELCKGIWSPGLPVRGSYLQTPSLELPDLKMPAPLEGQNWRVWDLSRLQVKNDGQEAITHRPLGHCSGTFHSDLQPRTQSSLTLVPQ